MANKSNSEQEILREKIKDLFYSNPKSNYNYKQISKKINEINAKARKNINIILLQLAKDNIITELYKGKFILNPAERIKNEHHGPKITGIVDMKQTGKAYVISPELLEDIRINPNNTNRALHGDTVVVQLFPKRKNQKTEGQIVEIIKRNKINFVGIIEIHKNFAFLVPDNKSTPIDIYIPLENLNKAKNGEKAIAQITEWPEKAKNPFGKIIDVLGKPGLNEVEMHAILAEYNLPYSFDKQIEKEADKIATEISSQDIVNRRDLRDILTFTIDPYDAKDFDDALSLEIVSEDSYKIGVHIADVSHYIKENSILDEEAFNRATSVYLVDRVVPMLPEKISNFICSLREKEDKLTYSVIFDISKSGKINNYSIEKTIINSNKRFTYEEVQEIIENNNGQYSNEIEILNKIAKIIRKKRLKSGAISFDKKEVKFKLDDKGKPISVFYKEQKDAHKLVEEFMLLANKTVAEHIGKGKGKSKPKTFVYRIHDIPNPEKLNNLSEFVAKLGYKMKTDTRKNISNSFNTLLKDCEGKGEENLIETLAIRSMAKAEYSTQNIGHYGLAFDYYTHFTSPIRRYPDLMVHRLLWKYSNGLQNIPAESLEEKCIHSTEREKVAQYAERDSIKLKQVEFLEDKIGQSFEGVISGVSKWGLFVEIVENKCEGMVRLKDMNDDYYYLDEDNYQVIGFNKKRKYKLGDSLMIKIKGVDAQRKEIDFIMTE
jgi:ribonuclease R